MSVSVVMTTRNGARFLGAQLASVAAQSRLPDQLVVGDDASEDSTVTELRAFARAVPFPVHIDEAASPAGVVVNIERALGRAEGDLIALADQDDRWRPEKLERLVQAAAPTGTMLVFSDADIVDEHGDHTGRRLWASLDFSDRQRRALTERPPGPLLRHSCASGCTLLIKRSVRDLALPFPDVLDDEIAPMLHDRWLGLIAACVGRVAAVEAPLMEYRVHDDQQTGAGRDSRARQVRQELATGLAPVRSAASARLRQLGALVERLTSREITLAPAVEDQLRAALAHQAMRAELSDRRRARLGPIVRDLWRGGYRQSSFGAGTALVDLLRGAAHD